MLHSVTSIKELSKPLQVIENIIYSKMQSYDKSEKVWGGGEWKIRLLKEETAKIAKHIKSLRHMIWDALQL